MSHDAIVIGAGAVGSAAAYYLARSGQRMLLLEQFALDHQMGSSYGQSRIIRYAYDHPAYIAMASATYPLWEALEAESGEELLIKTGGLDFGSLQNPDFAATRQAMLDMNIPFEELSPAQVAKRFPQFRLDDDMLGLYQPDAGLLRASKCVQAHVRLAQQHGADFRSECPVTSITPLESGVRVETTQGTFEAARLVIAAGGWAKSLLAMLDLSLPLEVTREQLCFFAAPSDYDAGNIPIYIGWGDETFYGIGSVDGTGFKCARHHSDEPTTVETVNRTPDATYTERVRQFLRQHIPVVADNTLIEQRICLYTNTPDHHFVLDQHPAYPQIAIGAGFSGHGFKFSTLLGKLLADRVLGLPITLDLSLFGVDRF